jgi:hypothetical protein
MPQLFDHARIVDPESPAVVAVRDRLFEGKVDTPTLMAVLRKKQRSISRMIAHGLPYTRIGHENWFDLDEVKAWLGRSSKRCGPPRGPGRPRFYGTPDHQPRPLPPEHRRRKQYPRRDSVRSEI